MFSGFLRRLIVTFLMPCVMFLGFPQRSYAVVPIAAVAWVVSVSGGVYRTVKAVDIAIGLVIGGIAIYVDSYLNSSTPPSVTPTSTAAYIDLTPATAYNQNKNAVNTDSAGNTIYRVNYSGSASTPITNLTFGCSIAAPNYSTAALSLGSCIPTNAIGSCATKFVSVSPDYAVYGFDISCALSSTPKFSTLPAAVSVSSSATSALEGTPCQFRNVDNSLYSNGAPGCSQGPIAGIQSSPSSSVKLQGAYADQSVSFSLGTGSSSSGYSLSISGSAAGGLSGANVTTGPYNPSLGGYPVTNVVAVPVSNTGTGSKTDTGSNQPPPFVMPCGIAGSPPCSVAITESIATSTSPVLTPISDSDRPDAVSWLQSRLPSTPSFTWSHPFTSKSCSPIPVSYSIFGKSYSHSWDFCKFVSFYQDALSWLAYLFTCFQLYALALAPRRESTSSI